MKVPNQVQASNVGFNMTPMIDVVFLLIIFFLVSSHLAKQEAQMELELPNANSGSGAVDDPAPRVVINVTSNGGLLVGGHRISQDQLTERLNQRVQIDGHGLEVRIRTARQANYATVRPILLSCTQVGIWNVSFAVYRPQEGS